MKNYENFEEYLESGLQSPDTDEAKGAVLELCKDTFIGYEKSSNLASIALFCVDTFKLYKTAGFDNLREFLKDQGFTPGTIAHKIAYGKFCHEMRFSVELLPSEFCVRPILNKIYAGDAKDIYLKACKKSYNNKRASSKAIATGQKSEENAATDDESDDGNSSDPPHDTQDVESLMDDEKELFKFRPGITEIKEALKEHKMSLTDQIFLDSIKETVSSNADFVSDVLKKYKRKIRTVPLLASVVTDFTRKTAIPENLFPEINKFAEKLHEEESRLLTEAMNGKISAEEETAAEDYIED